MDSPKRGRPPLLTPELIQEAEQLLPFCVYSTILTAHLGIGRWIWCKWVREGKRLKRQQDQGKVIDPADQIKIDLVEAIDRAMANREIELAKTIQKASIRHWQAAAWLLERTTPERWGDDRKELALIKKRQNEMEARLEEELKKKGLKPFRKAT
jgi:hypothetical protein